MVATPISAITRKLPAAIAYGDTDGVPPQNRLASAAYLNECTSNSNGSSCENQPTSVGVSCGSSVGLTHMKPAPGPPQSHLTQLPSTTSAPMPTTDRGKMPADCAMSTMQRISRARHSSATWATGVTSEVVKCTC